MIAIFGDSYGEEINITKGGYLEGWPSILGKMYDEEVENFSKSSTSISYSYQKFKGEQNLSKHSKVIFIVADPTRQLFIDDKETKSIHFQGDVNRSVQNNKYFNIDLNLSDKRVLEYQENITAFYPDTWNFVKRAVKGDVLHSHKNALVLNVTELSHITTLGLNTPMAPWFTTSKGEEWNTKYMESGELGRVCHFSPQQNIELAVLIKDYFDNGIDIDNEIICHTDKHFTIPESMEDAGLKLRR